jgi:hypothetical protein
VSNEKSPPFRANSQANRRIKRGEEEEYRLGTIIGTSYTPAGLASGLADTVVGFVADTYYINESEIF